MSRPASVFRSRVIDLVRPLRQERGSQVAPVKRTVGAALAALIGLVRMLDLDHVGAQHRELVGRKGAGQHMGDVDDADTFEGSRHAVGSSRGMNQKSPSGRVLTGPAPRRGQARTPHNRARPERQRRRRADRRRAPDVPRPVRASGVAEIVANCPGPVQQRTSQPSISALMKSSRSSRSAATTASRVVRATISCATVSQRSPVYRDGPGQSQGRRDF